MAHAAAVVSLSTRPESFGRTVLEALSLGTPVVGYDHGGVGEILNAVYPEGRVRVGDHAAAANRLAESLPTRPQRAKPSATTTSTSIACARKTLAVYEGLAGHPPTAAVRVAP